MKLEVLVEKFLITEWRGDAIYKTKSEGLVWVDRDSLAGQRKRDGDYLYVAPPTSYTMPTIRPK